YGRLRAEAGVPLFWLFPYYMQKQALPYTFAPHPFLASGQATLSVWALFVFLARGYFPQMTGYQLAGMELARRTRIRPQREALSILRLRFAGFPFHPLGYAMTCSYGDLIWGPFLVVWLLKSLVLRWGGMALYRKSIPLMLGLALGHFAVAGILWGLTGAWFGD